MLEELVVRIKHFHATEIISIAFSADAYDDDAERLLRSLDDGLDRRFHVVDHTVCENQQDKVLLITLAVAREFRKRIRRSSE